MRILSKLLCLQSEKHRNSHRFLSSLDDNIAKALRILSQVDALGLVVGDVLECIAEHLH